MSNNNDILDRLTTEAYEYGFVTDIEMDIAPKGLNEGIVRFISAKKNEPHNTLIQTFGSDIHFNIGYEAVFVSFGG